MTITWKSYFSPFLKFGSASAAKAWKSGFSPFLKFGNALATKALKNIIPVS